MDIEKHLIFVKDQDKTEQIEACYEQNGKWTIQYRNSNKPYQYLRQNVEWYQKPKIVDGFTHNVYAEDQPLKGVVKIIDFGRYVRLVFKTGYHKVYLHSTLLIEEARLSDRKAQSCFEYFKVLSHHVSVNVDGKRSILGKQYDELTTISPRSALHTYLSKTPIRKEEMKPNLIFPFSFNLSQKAATERALTEQISIIEGPPGTGKTQTILNIIANAVLNGKTVAVVSNNNSATANVLEKLVKHDLDFIAAYLGSKQNRDNFFRNQKETLPITDSWKVSNEEKQTIFTNLAKEQYRLDEMLQIKNRLARLKQELAALKTEYRYFVQYYNEFKDKTPPFKSYYRLSSDKLTKLIVTYKATINDQGDMLLKNKIYNFLSFGVYTFKLYRYPPEVVVSYLQKMYYETKREELLGEIDQLEQTLGSFRFEDVMQQYSKQSMKLFKAQLADKYHKGERKAFSSDVLWKQFDSFIKEYPVILSTTHSLRNCAAKNYLFDYVLIDEASQVDVVTGALALSCAKHAVIVGDLKQLPNVVPSENAEISKQLFQKFELDQAYSYADHSLLSSIQYLFEGISQTLLKEHYRCHPKIIGFCNQKFYQNELIVLTEENEDDKPLVLYKTVKGNHARGKFNQRQIDIIFEEVIPNEQKESGQTSLGIITPYRLQAEKLQSLIDSDYIDADTVHKYQGRERDIIILSTVANEVGAEDFVDDPNLINVAVSRAVDKLVVIVAEGSENWKGTNINDLVSYIKYHNFDVIESTVHSVFDLLYNSYSDKLLEFMSSTKQVSRFASENLMNTVIEKVLTFPLFQTLDYVLHQPLRMLLKDVTMLTDSERKFALNILTHTDFVIYNKIDKMPVLVVEVDGHAYHENNAVQLKRDKMKDEILQKYGIPIIRMKTTGSGEETAIIAKLSQVLAN